jgi:hypothetical protein
VTPGIPVQLDLLVLLDLKGLKVIWGTLAQPEIREQLVLLVLLVRKELREQTALMAPMVRTQL